jgi:hypothetical protein
MNLTITADTASAASGIADVEARLAALEAAFIASSGAADASGAALTKHAAATTGAGAAMKELDGHVRVVSMGLGALGLEADATAVKISALAEIVKTAEESFGPLLLIAGAIAALGAAVSVFTDGVKSASAFETQMTALGTAVRLTGGDWDKTKGSVEQYLEVQERATGFDANEVLSAMRALVVAGASVRDAQTEIAIAEDTARATGESLEEVINKVIEAEAGRATGLARLDPKLRDLIRSHADLFAIMQQLEHDMSGQAAAAADTYAGSVQRLGAAWDTMKRDVGGWLVPWLTDLTNLFIGLGIEVGNVANALGKLDLVGAVGAIGDDPLALAHKQENDAEWERKHQLAAALRRGTLDNNPTMGSGAGSGDGYEPAITRPEKLSAIGDPRQIDSATTMMKAFAGVEEELQAKVTTASTALEKQNAQIALAAQRSDDAKAEVSALTSFTAADSVAIDAATKKRTDANAAYDQSVAAVNAYERALKGEKTVTDGQKMALAELKQKMDDAKDALAAATAQVQAANTAWSQHHTELDRAQADVLKTGAAYTAAANESSDATTAFGLQELRWMTDSEATMEKTNAQKFAYFKKLYADMLATGESTYQELDEIAHKQDESFIAALEDQEKAYKKTIDDETKATASFIDDIVLKHTSMRDELKSIFDQIAKNYIDAFAKQAIGANGQGWLGSLLNGAGGIGGTQATYVNGALKVHLDNVGGDATAKLTGNTSGVSSSSAQAQLNTLPPGGGGSGGGGLGEIFGLVGAAGAGTAVGSGIGSLLSGGKSDAANSGIGGAAGAAIAAGLLLTSGPFGAAILASPIGAAVVGGAAAVGSAIGGLFGPHETPAQQPDAYDQNYNQDLANWQGNVINSPMGQFSPTSQYWTANGGVSQSQQISSMIDTANLSSLTQAQQSIVQQLITLNGGTSGNNLAVTDEHQGVVTLVSGQKISVSDWESLISQYTTAFGSGGTGSPIYDITRSYPDFNLGTLNATGSSTPPNGGTNVQTGNTTVIIQNPTIVGPAGLKDVAVAIGTAINRAANGTIPGSPSTWRGIGPNLRNANQGLG